MGLPYFSLFFSGLEFKMPVSVALNSFCEIVSFIGNEYFLHFFWDFISVFDCFRFWDFVLLCNSLMGLSNCYPFFSLLIIIGFDIQIS